MNSQISPALTDEIARKQVIYLAYDGSINADWVSRYAIRMAAHAPSGKLNVLHIPDGLIPLGKIQEKLAAIKAECQSQQVEFHSEIIGLRKDVFTTLMEVIPASIENYCICGMRMTSRGKGFLAGTISEKLLRCKQFNVFAIRVVNPGLLGCPSDLLFPLAGHPQGFRSAMTFLLMLAPCIHKVYVLRIMQTNSLWFRYLSPANVRNKLREGEDYVKKAMKEIRQRAGNAKLHLDRNVVISDDWAKEILIEASKIRAKMILLGASDRNLPSRFFYGNKLEQILRKTSCDVGIYRKI